MKLLLRICSIFICLSFLSLFKFYSYARQYVESPIATGSLQHEKNEDERNFAVLNAINKKDCANDVDIIENNNEYCIKDLETDEELYTVEKIQKIAYVTISTLNVRKAPNISSQRFNYIQKNTKVLKVAELFCGWDIIKIGEDLFFVWGEYLTEEQPEDIIILDKLEKEQIIIASETVDTTRKKSGYTYVGGYTLTAYMWSGNPCADGVYPSLNHTVACNDPYLWHKWIYIEGYGTYYVHDTGGMASNVIDIYLEDYDTCMQFGVQYGEVYIIN